MSSAELTVTKGSDLNMLVISFEPEFVFEKFYRQYNGSLLALIISGLKKHSCGRPTDHAEDVQQYTYIEVYDAFNACFQNLKQAEFTNPRGWLNTIAYRQIFNHFSNNDCHKKETTVANFEQQNGGGDASDFTQMLSKIITRKSVDLSRINSIEIQAERNDLLKQIYGYLNTFEDDKRTGFLMRMYGYTYPEIADELHISEENARKKIGAVIFKVKNKFGANIGG